MSSQKQPKPKKHTYFVDFGTWVIEAETPEDAREKAIKDLGAGELPAIDSVTLATQCETEAASD